MAIGTLRHGSFQATIAFAMFYVIVGHAAAVSGNNVCAETGADSFGTEAFESAAIKLGMLQKHASLRVRSSTVANAEELQHKLAHGVVGALEGEPQKLQANRPSSMYSQIISTIPFATEGCVAITGTTSGLGEMAAQTVLQEMDYSVRNNSCLLLLNRISSRSDETEVKFRNLSNGTFIETIECDLQNFSSVREAAAKIGNVAQSYGGLSVLVLNAGIFDFNDTRTSDGFDLMMQTNHLSHFLLTKLLLPSLRVAAERYGQARIVTHSSIERHGRGFSKEYFMKSEPGTLGGFSGFEERYHQTKLANAAFAMALERKLAQGGPNSRIKALSAAPGLVSTGMTNSTWLNARADIGDVADGVCPLLKAMFAADAYPGDFYEPEDACGIYGWPVKVIEGGIPIRKTGNQLACDESGNQLACDESQQEFMWKATEEGLGEEFHIDMEQETTRYSQRNLRDTLYAIPRRNYAILNMLTTARMATSGLPTRREYMLVGILVIAILFLALILLRSQSAAMGGFFDDCFLQHLPINLRLSYLCLALALTLAMLSYSCVLPVKTAIFLDLVGASEEPMAKSLCLLVLFPFLVIYNLVFSATGDPKSLVVIVAGAFAVLYAFTAFMLKASEKDQGAWIAWLLYYTTECRGVILMPMIWSIINDVTPSRLARKVYPLIFFAVQLGGIGGSIFAVNVERLGGELGLLLVQAAFLIVIGILVRSGVRLHQLDQAEGNCDERSAPSQITLPHSTVSHGSTSQVESKTRQSVFYEAFEGLWLLFSRPYVFMIFWVSYATLMPRTILDYNNIVVVNRSFLTRDEQIAYFGHMSLVQSSATALLTLVGTRIIVEKLGLTCSLLILPCTLMFCTLTISVANGLLTSTFACVLSSVMAYGLNSPSKEILYIRTSREIKYKAKSWSETYGNELMKLLGAQVNLWINNEKLGCIPNCFDPVATTCIVIAWVAVWMIVAIQAGRKHLVLEAGNKIVN